MTATTSAPFGDLQVVAPFWLDRPDEEAVEIAIEAWRNGFGAMWLGEMATFDAFALATAVGLRAPGLALKIGPLAVGVRSPVALALGSGLGHDPDRRTRRSRARGLQPGHRQRLARPPVGGLAPRARETVEAVRSILAGERAAYAGQHVRTHGFRLRQPQPDAKISLAAFGPRMTRVAAVVADEVVLNLVTPERVAQFARSSIPRHALATASRRRSQFG